MEAFKDQSNKGAAMENCLQGKTALQTTVGKLQKNIKDLKDLGRALEADLEQESV
jgi:hypothetical protein